MKILTSIKRAHRAWRRIERICKEKKRLTFSFVLPGLLITEKMNGSFDAKMEIYDL